MTEETEQSEETEETQEEQKDEGTQEEQPEKKPEDRKEALREMSPNNVVFVGKKGVMNYVMAVMTQFNQGIGTVSVKARGRAISRAVDVAEILKNKFLGEVKVRSIDIQTEELDNMDGTRSKGSAIEIKLNK